MVAALRFQVGTEILSAFELAIATLAAPPARSETAPAQRARAPLAPAPTPAAGQPFLSIRGVSRRFGKFTALDEVSLDVERGEFVCFLGPSGCGKTTLLRAIAGLDVQTSGRIWQDGRDISALPPAARDFGIVFQSYALFPNLSAADNVAYGLRSCGHARTEIRRRVADLLALVGLAGGAGKYPAQLSGGEQQRVALARALALAPGLLLLDEPLSALDARVRARLRRELRDLHGRLGLTTIMVTHDQDEALTMADRIVVMNGGKVEQVGTPVDIYRRPATPFVADFVGRMNFLPGRLIAADRVRIGPLELVAEHCGGLPPNAEVTVAFRPEDLQVRGINAGRANTLAAGIEDLEFGGDHYIARLSAADLAGAGIVAHFSVNLVRDLNLVPGSRLRLALPAERIRVFGADA